jgi:hypothetical protein
MITDPDFYLARIGTGSRIPKQQQKRCGKKFVVIPFYVATNFHKIDNYFGIEMLKKQIWVNFQKIVTFYPKNCHQALKNMGLGSRIRDPEKTYSGSRI